MYLSSFFFIIFSTNTISKMSDDEDNVKSMLECGGGSDEDDEDPLGMTIQNKKKNKQTNQARQNPRGKQGGEKVPNTQIATVSDKNEIAKNLFNTYQGGNPQQQQQQSTMYPTVTPIMVIQSSEPSSHIWSTQNLNCDRVRIAGGDEKKFYQTDAVLGWAGKISDLLGSVGMTKTLSFERSKLDFLRAVYTNYPKNESLPHWGKRKEIDDILLKHTKNVQIGLFTLKVTNVLNTSLCPLHVESLQLIPELVYNDKYCAILAPYAPVPTRMNHHCNTALTEMELENLHMKMELAVEYDRQLLTELNTKFVGPKTKSKSIGPANAMSKIVKSDLFIKAPKKGNSDYMMDEFGDSIHVTDDFIKEIETTMDHELKKLPMSQALSFTLSSFGDESIARHYSSKAPSEFGNVMNGLTENRKQALSEALGKEGFEVQIMMTLGYKLYMSETSKRDLVTELNKSLVPSKKVQSK